MKKLITNFQQTGNCVVDIKKVVKAWNNKFSISQFDDKYTLVKQSTKSTCAKVQISRKQAEEIISNLNLRLIKSSIFRSGKIYRSEQNIISEIERFEKLALEKSTELEMLKSVISEYKSSLK